MDQAFACPECGTMVGVGGLAPGRQVRCGFCHRLLEVPFLPRVEIPGWRRRKFGRPWWVPWAWGGLGLAVAAVIVTAAIRFLERHERASLDHSFHQLLSSSEAHERSGEPGKALVDLDAALHLHGQAARGDPGLVSRLKARRAALAGQDAVAVADRLSTHGSSTFPLGQWLTLQARAGTDKDLFPLRQEIAGRFQAKLKRHVQAELAAAGVDFESGNPVLAFDRCSALDGLIGHVAPPEKERFRLEADELVSRIMDRHGLLVESPRGHFLAGSESRYKATLIAALCRALKQRGYLPHDQDHGEIARWSRAPFRLTVILNERHEGTYLSSENRLTRIDAQLILTCRGKELWKTTPTARTAVPLPRIPAYLSSRLAFGSTRIEEFERLLYDDARNKIDEKIGFALGHMPACGQLSQQSGL